jgi:carboxymethylenebutenolidase
MPMTEVSVPTPDGICRAVLAVPDGEGTWPAVVLYPDAGSLRPTFVTMAERLAASGFVVIVPDLYHRSAPYEPFDVETVFDDPGERARLGEMSTTVTPEAAARDGAALLDFLSTRPETAPMPVGAVGYCLSGGMALRLAADHPDRVRAVATFHGGQLGRDDPSSPHHRLGTIAATVYVGVAADDWTFPADQEERLREALVNAGVEHTIEHYDASHGFAVADNPTYDPVAGERHWKVLVDLLR